MMCEWQSDGQCSMESTHSKAEAGNVPSWVSVAVPLNEMVWPTVHVSEATGVVIEAVGGALPAETVLVVVPMAPSESVTCRPTTTSPTAL